MKKNIAVLAGDGIGPEVMTEALMILKKIGSVFEHEFTIVEALIGGDAWEHCHNHFPDETKEICEKADAILFGSVGGPTEAQSEEKWKDAEKNSILGIRKYFGLNCNLRPVKSYPMLANQTVLKEEIAKNGIDILCIRELSGDLYFGEHKTEIKDGHKIATDLMIYDDETIRNIARIAFRASQKRKRTVHSVDKANVLDCSRLWREVVNEVAKEYPDCAVKHILVDNCAMQLMIHPSDFDVLLMPNMFGDILSDQASVFSGSLGMLPSASLNKEGFGLYEPAGGSAPDIAGKGIANPIAQILSAAMMLKYSFNLNKEHDAIVNAVEQSLKTGYRTKDIAGDAGKVVSTKEMSNAILNFIS